MNACFDAPRNLAFALLAVAALAACVARPASAAWSSAPAEIHATTDICAPVSACADGTHGAVVVWQQQTGGTIGPILARHVLSSGNVDPAWPAPATVCATVAARGALGAIADDLGGAYVWWTSGATLLLTRIGPDGAIAAGWPAAGRVLGQLPSSKHRPNVTTDGAHGVYLSWTTNEFSLTSSYQLVLVHLGPANTAAGGFPASGRRVIGAPEDDAEWVGSHAIAPASGGGLWVLKGTSIPDVASFLDGEWRLTRLTAAGLPAAGWDAHGVVIGTFPGARLDSDWSGWMNPVFDGCLPMTGLSAIAEDGAGGVYVERHEPVPDATPLQMQPHLYRLDAAGSPFAGWPAGGVLFDAGTTMTADFGADFSLRALPDGAGNVYAGHMLGYTDSEPLFGYARVSSAAIGLAGGVSTQAVGADAVLRGDGGLFLAGFNPQGPWHLYAGPAFVQVVQSEPGPTWVEYHNEQLTVFYDDVAMASTEDGGAILFWSQESVRHGIYAMKVDLHGPVTGVPGPTLAGPSRLALHFGAGLGVTAFATFAAPGRVRARLHDLAGRIVSESEFVATAGPRSWLLPGTASLPAGIYLARIDRGGESLRAKVAVVR